MCVQTEITEATVSWRRINYFVNFPFVSCTATEQMVLVCFMWFSRQRRLVSLSEDRQLDPPKKMNRRQYQWTSFLAPLIFLCATTVVFAAFRIHPNDASCDRHRYPWSPALQMVEYRWETFKNHQFSISTPYFGFKPTDQIENAWDELIPS